MNISKNNTKIIAGISIVVLVSLVFCLIYYPKLKEVRRLAKEFRTLTSNIRELYDAIGGKDKLTENIIKLRKSVSMLNEVFPSEKEMSHIIKDISDKAERFKIDVISITPKELQVYRDNSGAELKVMDGCYKCMPVSMSIEARYQALGEFLMSLEVHKRPLMYISSMNIYKDEGISPKLKIDIEMDVYVVGR
jgi:Tfp pilus assembly protein PilO